MLSNRCFTVVFVPLYWLDLDKNYSSVWNFRLGSKLLSLEKTHESDFNFRIQTWTMLKETYSPTNGYILCDTHEWWPGKAKSMHITQREQEHKSGTLEELSCSYQVEKQISLQRTLQRVTQILQQHPLTHALFTQEASNFIQQRSGVHSTGVDFPLQIIIMISNT